MLDQREAVLHVGDVGVLRPVELVDGDPDPLLDVHPCRYALRVGVSEQLADLLLDRPDLELPRASLHFTRKSYASRCEGWG